MLVSHQASPPLPARLVAGSAFAIVHFIHHGWLEIALLAQLSPSALDGVLKRKDCSSCSLQLEYRKGKGLSTGSGRGSFLSPDYRSCSQPVELLIPFGLYSCSLQDYTPFRTESPAAF